MSSSQNEALYALFASSYSLAAAFAAHIADEVDATADDAPASIRATELATVAPGKVQA